MATIKAIDVGSVHQIQSGQVIVDLKSVVKELVENSLDAGATSIEVRFKNQGLDSVEIADNGKGIAPEDFATVALKHHTSKLTKFDDLSTLDTFGFRGEALSSLCALSKFNVVTARAEDGALGRRLEFEKSGKLSGTTTLAAQQGTTVSVADLFFNLPVRRKELEKNIKREYGKVIEWLHAYACISVGVRLAVTNQGVHGKKVAVFSTMRNGSTKENIVNVFGAKCLLALIPLDLHLHLEPSHGPGKMHGLTNQGNDPSLDVHVQGHISRPVFGEGRQAPDRQMFFVNSRPCALPQVAKAMNEVYKSFNVSQSPFIFANLLMDANAYDVNVSPDKRTIMLHDQSALLESLKATLTELFEQADHTVPQSFPGKKLPMFQPLNPRQGKASLGSTPQTEEDDNDSSGEDVRDSNQHPAPFGRQRIAQGERNPIHDWVERDTTARSVLDARNTIRAKDLPRGVETSAHHSRSTSISDESDNHFSVHEAPDEVAIPGVDAVAMNNPERQVSRDNSCFSNGGSTQPTNDRQHLEIQATPENLNRGRDPEEPISAITPSSHKFPVGPVQTAFDRMRPARTPAEIIEITIGDKTTTTTMGNSTFYKKRRMHDPQDSQSIAKFVASPLHARNLRSFAAAGSQMEFDSDDMSLAVSAAQDDPSISDEGDDASVHSASASESNRTQDIDAGSMVPSSERESFDSQEDLLDGDYLDESAKKAAEDEKISRLIEAAEEAANRPSKESAHRATQLLNRGSTRKDSTVHLQTKICLSVDAIERLAMSSSKRSSESSGARELAIIKEDVNDSQAEQRLSLTVSKSDFGNMRVVGQFNLGFILAFRPAKDGKGGAEEDDLFIIDQHAADEKSNYERLQQTVTLHSQRLVRPKQLDLSAVEAETVASHAEALKANGFEIEMHSSNCGDSERRDFRLTTLPTAGNKTFDLSDLEELLHLLTDLPGESKEIPRPRKVQRMLAMRACRSSIMVGKTLTRRQMEKVVTHLGELEKPWNCPHGRPTMRHLAGMGAWEGWNEGDWASRNGPEGSSTGNDPHTVWKSWLHEQRRQ